MKILSQMQNSKLGNNHLRKELGFIDASALVIGMVIGSGIFFKPAIVFKNAGSAGLGIAAWIIGGLITLAAGLTVGEIAAAIPETGGLFTYLRKLYGEKWAFLLGWVQTLVYVPGTVAAQAIIFATEATFFIPMTNTQKDLLASGAIIFVMIVNIVSAKLGGKIQIVFTIAKLFPIIAIIIFGFINGTVGETNISIRNATTVSGFGVAILGTLWAYDGWIGVGNVAGELKHPTKDLPKAIIYGLIFVIATYTLINFAMLKALPINSIIASEKPASDVAVIIFGKTGAGIISIGIMISIFGALNGYFMTGARVPFVMAEKKLLFFPNYFSKISKTGTPINSLIFECILAIIYVISGTFNKLTNLVVFVLWIFFTMAIAGVFILRKRNMTKECQYKVPLYPFIPIVGIAGGLFIIINTIFTDTANALYGIVVTLIGFPVYIYLAKNIN